MDWQDKKKAVENLLETKCPNDFKCMELDDETFSKIEIKGSFLKCPHNPDQCDFILPQNGDINCLCPVANFVMKKIEDSGEIIEFKKFWNLHAVMEKTSPCEFWENTAKKQGYCTVLGKNSNECDFEKTFNFRTCCVWTSKNKPPVLIAELTFG